VAVDTATSDERPMIALTYLEVVVVAVAAPVAIALGAPLFGCVLGAGAWVLQRLIHAADRRWTARLREPRQQLGANLFEAFGRIWLLGGAIVVAGAAGHRSDGLSAALMIFGAYSVAFVIRILSGPPKESGPPKRSVAR
jgi:hypothetical protein